MKKILFITGNQRKIEEAKLACEPLGIEVLNKSMDVDEIQSSNPGKVTEYKVKAAYMIAKEPVVVTDTFWSIPSLKGFPGAYMKDVASWFTEQDFINLMQDKDDRRISFTENIAYYDGKVLKTFSKEFWGSLVPPRGVGISIENVSEFEGKTLGERRAEGGYSHKPEDYVWIEFARWFTGISN